MAAYLRQSFAGLLPTERQAIEHLGLALSPSAIAMVVALDALDLALARSQRIGDHIEQPSGGEQLVVGTGEGVAQGTEVETSSGVHADESQAGSDLSGSPFAGIR